MPLYHATPGYTTVLHHAPVAVLLAVLLAGDCAQKHLVDALSAGAPLAPEGRSSLHAFSTKRTPAISRKSKTYEWAARGRAAIFEVNPSSSARGFPRLSSVRGV